MVAPLRREPQSRGEIFLFIVAAKYGMIEMNDEREKKERTMANTGMSTIRGGSGQNAGIRILGVPLYAWICFCAMLALQMTVFYATRIPLAHMTLRDMTIPLDHQIPFIPGWVTVYFAAYLSWLVSALWILSEGKIHGYRFACAYMLSLLISAVVFLAYPGTMERPQLVGEGLLMDWMRFLYRVDSPTNLCPSLHVLISYFCWRGTMGCRRIPRWYRWFNFVFLILVCLSILFVKQHALVDIPAAILIGELALQLAEIWRLERIPFSIERICTK